MNIIKSTHAFETWLKEQLKDEFVRKDLDKKHAKMCEDPFPFLRATYYRWAETILTECPELAQAPSVVAVGDIHLENFGTWRDDEGRLIWGVNDFDEAAEMPYALDLVRLGVSAVLGCPHIRSTRSICDNILTGYRRGLRDPHPIVLDEQYAWLRKLTVASNKERADFWREMEKDTKKRKKGKEPPIGYVKTLAAAMPEPKLKMELGPRSAGLGSRGRPRWIAMAEWRGGRIVREAKAVLPSAWTLVNGRKAQPLYGGTIATARYRAPDPWYALVGKIVVRRLSPNNRKLEAENHALELIDSRMLRLMGRDLAAVHLGLGDHGDAVRNDFKKRNRGWLHSAVERMAKFVLAEQKQWRRAQH
jgi:Uncharacterized protein conserved in bacteria (DUF2252)